MLLRLLTLVVTLAATAGAQTPDTTQRAPGATVSGVAYDSLGLRPLAGAVVQLVDVGNPAAGVRSATADEFGSFSFRDVADGGYLLGFLHPLLDSLGIEPALRELVVAGRRSVIADIWIPSPRQLLAAICGEHAVRDSAAVIFGVVRDAQSHLPLAGVSATGSWQEFAITRDGFSRRVQRVAATTSETGWFSLCNVPRPGTTTVVASRGADSTALIEIPISREAVIRRDLYVGPARMVAMEDTLAGGAAGSGARRIVQSGEGRLSGTVASITGAPIAGAQVFLTDGPGTTTNAKGEWSLVDLPLGTRALEVRAIGYYPARRAVNVFTGAPDVHVALPTFRAVLDTVRVIAARWRDDYRVGFEARRQTGLGRFLTAEQIARRDLNVASDLFRGIAGIAMEQGLIKLRRGDSDCSPAFFLDGVSIPGAVGDELSAEDIDSWVRPHEIAAVEVYTDIVPPQFHRIQLGCGAIVIWTK